MELLNLNFHYTNRLKNGRFMSGRFLFNILFCLNSILRQNQKEIECEVNFSCWCLQDSWLITIIVLLVLRTCREEIVQVFLTKYSNFEYVLGLTKISSLVSIFPWRRLYQGRNTIKWFGIGNPPKVGRSPQECPVQTRLCSQGNAAYNFITPSSAIVSFVDDHTEAMSFQREPWGRAGCFPLQQTKRLDLTSCRVRVETRLQDHLYAPHLV